jgi:hypothetical protein
MFAMLKPLTDSDVMLISFALVLLTGQKNLKKRGLTQPLKYLIIYTPRETAQPAY